jgi:Protein of unknown function (DUF3800)
MIYGYFDESGESGDGHFVVAGFVGKRKDWKTFISLWREAKEDHGPLHLKDMRLGSSGKRYGRLLERLGEVPHKANLHAFAGSCKTSDYSSKIKGTIAEITLAGYNLALVSMIDAVLESKKIPKRDRIEFVFEDQFVFAEQRAQHFRKLRSLEKYKSHHGLSRIAKDSSQAKDILLEAADYLSYAVLQQLINPESQKSRLTESILRSRVEHTVITEDNTSQLLAIVYGEDLSKIPKMDKAKKKFILRNLDKYYSG